MKCRDVQDKDNGQNSQLTCMSNVSLSSLLQVLAFSNGRMDREGELGNLNWKDGTEERSLASKVCEK